MRTAQAYRYVLDRAEAWPRLHEALDGLDPNDVDDLARRARAAREIVCGAKLPDDLVAQIRCAYTRLRGEYGDDLTVAVRSSATAEDLPTASFAGPAHHIMVNVGNPDAAFQTGLLPTDGVGLARLEFIVAEHIRVHPMVLKSDRRTITGFG